MGCISFVLGKDGIGGGSPHVWGDTQMRVPSKKDSSNGPFVSANLVPDPLAANNADKETFHMAEKNSRNFFLLSIKLGELQTSSQLPSPCLCLLHWKGVDWRFWKCRLDDDRQYTPPHLDLSRLLLIANDPTVVSDLSVLFFHRRRQERGGCCWAVIFITRDVLHTVALPFTLKSILRQKKKNYENSNISTCKSIIL
jgi:hypothetical protein